MFTGASGDLLRDLRRRNFAVGNLETPTQYAGLAILFFFLTIFLRQVAGYSALPSGLTVLPVTAIMFALSRRLGALADRYGWRFFMGAGVGASHRVLYFSLGYLELRAPALSQK